MCLWLLYEQKNKVIQDNTYAKMARGEMVRYMAENDIHDYHEIVNFNDFGYQFTPQYSDDENYVFLRDPKQKRKL